MLKRTVKSCGSDASVVGVKSAEGKSARPGADEPAIRRRRGQESPIPRGERVISRKAIAQGMSDCLHCPVCSCAIFLSPLHTGPRVQRAPGIPARNGFNGLLRALLGDRALLPPSPCGLKVLSSPVELYAPPQDLTPTIEASDPHDFAVRFSTARQHVLRPLTGRKARPAIPSRARCRRVHHIPSQRSVTMANAPSSGTGWRES